MSSIPGLPADWDGNAPGSTPAENQALLLFDWFRRTRPFYVGQFGRTAGGQVSLTSGSLNNLVPGNGSSGGFAYTPSLNRGRWTTEATTGKLIVPADGWYSMSITGATLLDSATGTRIIRAEVNGSFSDAVSARVQGTTGNSTEISASGHLQLSAGDLLRLFAYQDSGATRDFDGYVSLLWESVI